LLTKDEYLKKFFDTAAKPIYEQPDLLSENTETVNTDSDMSGKSSPKGLLTSRSGTDSPLKGGKSRRIIKHRRTLEIEKRYRKLTNDHKTDFIDYLEFLVQFYKLITRLDAAGFTLQHVFGDN